MSKSVILLAILCFAAPGISAEADLPAIAIHIEPHADRTCQRNMPSLDETSINTTYDGVGRIDALVVLLRYGEARAASFGLTWPETWTDASWHDCGRLKIGDIFAPGDVTSIVLEDCASDSLPLILGWLSVTVTTPGTIRAIPSPKEGAIAIGDCNDISPGLAEIVLNLRGGAGGAKGDEISNLQDLRNRNWYVKPDSSGDTPTISQALREALPGDTVFVSSGTYQESLTLKKGVVIQGSWDGDFAKRDLIKTPSVIDATGFHTGVRATFGQDSTTVLDGFVITGASGKLGAGITLTNASSPMLRNLIIHSNTATFGGGIACRASSPVIQDVLIAGNKARSGGGIYCSKGASPLISNVTIVMNEASHGGAIFATEGSSPYVERSVLAGHNEGHAVYAADTASRIAISCSNLWSNLPSDFGGKMSPEGALRDISYEDPQFVDPSHMDFTLGSASPARSLGGCGRIGSRHAAVPGQ